MVNDRSIGSQGFNITDGQSIGQAQFQVGLNQMQDTRSAY